MADIFISYSKQDQDEARLLAAFLEAEGYSVWWDTSLISGESFRKVIMTELGRARAAIVIWTEHSIHSDWVQSEAGRAHADRKLIPVKAKGLAYKDIPPPFDNMHIENLGERDKILGAVVAQLAKPEVQPSALWMATRTLRLQLLTWAGIVGGAITLFTNLRGLVVLADWARWIVTHWQEWTHNFWNVAFGWIGIHLPPSVTPIVSLTVFVALLVIGTVLRSRHRVRISDLVRFVALSVGYFIWVFVVAAVIIGAVQAFLTRNVTVFSVLSVFAVYFAPFGIVTLWSKEKLQRFVMLLLLTFFWAVMIVIPLGPMLQLKGSPVDVTSAIVGYVSIVLAFFAILCFAPLEEVNKRLLFIVIGTLLLIAFNKFSVLGVQHFLEPPRV